MEQLTTYRAKGKEIGLIFLFKYNLNGNLKLFEISEGELNDEQMKWLFSSNYPSNEKIMKTVWMKLKKYLKVFEIEVSPADLSFEALWILYDYKESKKKAEGLFKRLTEEQKIKCFIQVPKYKKKLAKGTISQALLSTWLYQERFNDEY